MLHEYSLWYMNDINKASIHNKSFSDLHVFHHFIPELNQYCNIIRGHYLKVMDFDNISSYLNFSFCSCCKNRAVTKLCFIYWCIENSLFFLYIFLIHASMFQNTLWPIIFFISSGCYESWCKIFCCFWNLILCCRMLQLEKAIST